MIYSTINRDTQGAVATITLNRPEKLNSINDALAAELRDALEKAAADESIRAVLLTGSGRGFCAGQDLAEPLTPGKTVAEIVREKYNPIILSIRNMHKPVVCAVNGIAAGAGANLALACDLVLVAQSAYFTEAFSKIGLIPDCGGTFMLPRLVGMAKATEWMMLGSKISAEEALRWGLAVKVCEDHDLPVQALALAQELSQMPTKALALTKQLLNASMGNSLEAQLDMEANIQEQAAHTHDFQEGVMAFIQKRKPEFIGK